MKTHLIFKKLSQPIWEICKELAESTSPAEEAYLFEEKEIFLNSYKDLTLGEFMLFADEQVELLYMLNNNAIKELKNIIINKYFNLEYLNCCYPSKVIEILEEWKQQNKQAETET